MTRRVEGFCDKTVLFNNLAEVVLKSKSRQKQSKLDLQTPIYLLRTGLTDRPSDGALASTRRVGPASKTRAAPVWRRSSDCRFRPRDPRRPPALVVSAAGIEPAT